MAASGPPVVGLCVNWQHGVHQKGPWKTIIPKKQTARSSSKATRSVTSFELRAGCGNCSIFLRENFALSGLNRDFISDETHTWRKADKAFGQLPIPFCGDCSLQEDSVLAINRHINILAGKSAGLC